MSLPQPPEDPEMKKIIDKLAQFVARNGAEFENMTKQKQRENPQFAFLYGGPHYNYYQYRVTTEQVILKTQAQKLVNTEFVQGRMQELQVLEKELQQKTLSVADQIKQSEANLQAHEKAISQQQQSDIDAAIVNRRAEKVHTSAAEYSIDLEELEMTLAPLRTSCTKDNIQSAKSWVLLNITDSATCEFFSTYLINRAFTSDTNFEARLHLLYLINDIMHHCAKKPAEPLRRCMECVVLPIFCMTSSQAGEDQQPKLQKLLGIWTQHKYFIPEILEDLANPKASYQRYQSDQLARNADIVSQVAQAGVERLKSLQDQHQEFANHLNNELRALQKQYEREKNSIMMSSAPPPIMNKSQPPPPMSSVLPPNLNLNMPPPNYSQPPPDMTTTYGPPLPPSTAAGAMFNPSQPPPPRFSQPPPGFSVPPPTAMMAGPPPPVVNRPPPGHPPPNLSTDDLIPTAPYYELPAGLMVPLVKLADFEYKPLDPRDIRLPPPAPPSERLLQAVESFYQPPSHDCPVDAEGWEKLGLFEYYQSKNKEKKRVKEEKEAQLREQKRFKETKSTETKARLSRSRSRSRSPPSRSSRRRRSSRSPSRSPLYRRSSRSPPPSRRRRRSRSRSRSPAPYRRSSRSRSRSATPPRRRRGIDRRSPTPEDMPVLGMYAPQNMEMPLGFDNKGAQLLKKMGWGGAGLGASEQGIVDPVKAAEVRGMSDMYKGIGANSNDPFEAFRKSQSGTFIQKLKERDEFLKSMKKSNEESKN